MGLLDDAIREHLELKRLRGADPGEVAREQREALEAVPRGEAAAPAERSGAENEAEAIGEENPPDMPPQEEVRAPARPITGGPPVRAPQPVSGESPHTSQETAELDMSSVLNEEMDGSTGASSAPEAVAVRERTDETDEDPSESSMELEDPGAAPGGPEPKETRRQKRRRERDE
jgi:hypothetical protein